MLRLIIGGRASGKRNRLLSLGFTAQQIFDGETGPLEHAYDGPALDGLHAFVRRLMEAGEDPSQILDGIGRGAVCAVTCDEVGCGVIPLDGFDRDYREAVGRLCCELAAQAEIVERMYCGIPTVIKP